METARCRSTDTLVWIMWLCVCMCVIYVYSKKMEETYQFWSYRLQNYISKFSMNFLKCLCSILQIPISEHALPSWEKSCLYRCLLLPSKPILKHLPSSFSSFPHTGPGSFINIDFHSWVLIDPLFLLPGHLTHCSYSRPLPQWLWVIIRLSALGCAPACAQGPGSELVQHLECSTKHKMSLPCVFAFGSCIVSPSSMLCLTEG